MSAAVPDAAGGIPLPPEFAARVRDLHQGRMLPVTPREAATVVLLRDGRGNAGIEVYLMRRRRSMAFAAGAHVFPGGSVDPADAVPPAAWVGPSPREWGRVLHASATLAQALVCAAARETFEESGVLLAGGRLDAVTGVLDVERRRLAAGTVTFAEVLNRHGLALRSDLLRPWSRWVTPEVEPRRYDTWFFLAALPEGQQARKGEEEADDAGWLSPRQALHAARRGELRLMPPTAVTLAEIAGHPTVAAALAAAATRRLTPRLPQVRLIEGRALLVLPEEESDVD